MDTTLEEQLVESYPSLFQYYNSAEEIDGPPPQIAVYGIQCDDGWFELINTLCDEISSLNVNITIVQVKEKFGGLRFYYNVEDVEQTEDRDINMVHGLVRMAESMSHNICESCGEKGYRNTDEEKYRTLCDGCRNSL